MSKILSIDRQMHINEQALRPRYRHTSKQLVQWNQGFHIDCPHTMEGTDVGTQTMGLNDDALKGTDAGTRTMGLNEGSLEGTDMGT